MAMGHIQKDSPWERNFPTVTLILGVASKYHQPSDCRFDEKFFWRDDCSSELRRTERRRGACSTSASRTSSSTCSSGSSSAAAHRLGKQKAPLKTCLRSVQCWGPGTTRRALHSQTCTLLRDPPQMTPRGKRLQISLWWFVCNVWMCVTGPANGHFSHDPFCQIGNQNPWMEIRKSICHVGRVHFSLCHPSNCPTRRDLHKET